MSYVRAHMSKGILIVYKEFTNNGILCTQRIQPEKLEVFVL